MKMLMGAIIAHYMLQQTNVYYRCIVVQANNSFLFTKVTHMCTFIMLSVIIVCCNICSWYCSRNWKTYQIPNKNVSNWLKLFGQNHLAQ